jgi:3-dehydroquinate synthetase
MTAPAPRADSMSARLAEACNRRILVIDGAMGTMVQRYGLTEAAAQGAFLHGEAISLGLKAAVELSVAKGGLASPDGDRVIDLLRDFELPLFLDARLSAERILEKLGRDKKFVDGAIRFVLLRSLGDAFVSTDITREDMAREVHQLFLT